MMCAQQSAFVFAASMGRVQLLKTLWARGNVQVDGLAVASGPGWFRDVSTIDGKHYGQEGFVGRTALSLAINANRTKTVKWLLEYGANAASFVRQSDGLTALLGAVMQGNVAMAQLLMEHGGDPAAQNNAGTTALMYAAMLGANEMVAAILNHSGDTVAAFLNTRWEGISALNLAVNGDGNAETVATLIRAGANVNFASERDGCTALSEVVRQADIVVTQLLVDAGADLNVVDHDGWTALFVAVSMSGDDMDIHRSAVHAQMVQILLDAGAETDTKDLDYGVTALMWAAHRGDLEIVRLLLQTGASTEHRTPKPKTDAAFQAGMTAEDIATATTGADQDLVANLLANIRRVDLFRQFDSDRSAVLERHELLRLIETQVKSNGVKNYGTPQTAVEFVDSILESSSKRQDGSGTITQSEFVSFWTNLEQTSRKMWEEQEESAEATSWLSSWLPTEVRHPAFTGFVTKPRVKRDTLNRVRM